MIIESIGYNHKHDANFIIDRPNGCVNYLLLLIKSSAVFNLNGKIIHTVPNSFILYEPNTPQYYGADKTTYNHDYIHFFLSLEELNFLNGLNIPMNQVVFIGDLNDISLLLKSMCSEFSSSNIHRQNSINLYFNLIFYKINERVSYLQMPANINKGSYFEELMWIRTCIYRTPEEVLSIDDMARFVNVSRSRFQHLYKDTFGCNVTQDITNARIELACKLLNSTELSITEISYRCKFSSASYFNKKFKEKVGCTPLEFKLKGTSI